MKVFTNFVAALIVFCGHLLQADGHTPIRGGIRQGIRDRLAGGGAGIDSAPAGYCYSTVAQVKTAFANGDTAIYLCDGFNDLVPFGENVATIVAGQKVRVICLGTCVISDMTGSRGVREAFRVRSGGSLAFYGVTFEDFDNARIASADNEGAVVSYASCKFTQNVISASSFLGGTTQVRDGATGLVYGVSIIDEVHQASVLGKSSH